jgi:hypothetical protein
MATFGAGDWGVASLDPCAGGSDAMANSIAIAKAIGGAMTIASLGVLCEVGWRAFPIRHPIEASAKNLAEGSNALVGDQAHSVLHHSQKCLLQRIAHTMYSLVSIGWCPLCG